jgi:serine/threonine protein kinase
MAAALLTGTEQDRAEGGGGTGAESSDVFELTEQDLVEQGVIRYGGRYELLSLVGAGAYGSVYRARDSELDEIVAVKVLRSEHIVQPDALERFRSEVRLARRVAHPNVARTYDIGAHKDERFLTMEYIDGQPLTRLSPIGAAVADLLPLRLVIDIGVQLCAGLGALHAAGIVHRDMKTDEVRAACGGAANDPQPREVPPAPGLGGGLAADR